MPLGFAADIRPLFTQLDHDHMLFELDLWNYDDVKSNANDIVRRLRGQGGPVMPPPPERGGDGPWPKDKIDLFQSWIDGGCQP
jgi:hypothetical protein